MIMIIKYFIKIAHIQKIEKVDRGKVPYKTTTNAANNSHEGYEDLIMP